MAASPDMRIVLACNNPWGAGGQGNFLRRAAAGLQPHGQFEVFCRSAANGAGAGIRLHPVQASRVPPLIQAVPLARRRKDWIRLASDVAFDRQVAAEVAVGRPAPDLFVGVALQCAEALGTARERGARTWLYCLNAYIPLMKAEVEREYVLLGERGGAEIHPASVRRFLRECRTAEAIVVNSQFAARTFREAGHLDTPIHVLPPVVDADRFRPVPRERGAGPFTVLYVGTVTPRKGVHYLLDALAQLAPSRHVRLLLVGGAATRRLKHRVAEAQRTLPVEQFFRDFSRDDPAEVFGRADVLVLPSVEDGFGVVALEALASGVPVVVTSQCGAADAVREGENGFVVPVRDATALAERLEWMLRHPAEHQAMRAAARETALHFSQAAYNEQMAALIQASVPAVAGFA